MTHDPTNVKPEYLDEIMQMPGYDSATVMPTANITGKDGKIEWTHETDNCRVRPKRIPTAG